MAVFIFCALIERRIPVSFHLLAQIRDGLISGDYAEILEEFVFGLASETIKAAIN
jgi:hypothetical protein